LNKQQTASRQITEEVSSWPGVEAGPGRRGEFAFKVGRREIGHLHGDHVAHFGFPADTGAKLRVQGRVGPHPVAPDSPKLASRRIRNQSDVRDVIELMRLNYDRIVTLYGLPVATREKNEDHNETTST
jgi:hypothetical protein